MSTRQIGERSVVAAAPYPVTIGRHSALRVRTLRLTLRILTYVLLVIFAVVTAFPFFWMLSTSMKTSGALFVLPPQLLPDTWGTPAMWQNFTTVLAEHNFVRYTLNSIFVSTLASIGQLVTCSMAGFAFARMEFRGKNVILALLFATAIIPVEVTIIPEFLLGARIIDPILKPIGGWMNTFAPLIAPSFFVGTIGTFLMREFFAGIPRDLEEAAAIDGGNAFQIYRHVYVPLSTPAMTTLFLLAFITNWNALLRPVIYLRDSNLFTLPIGITRFQGIYQSDWNLVLAGSVVAIVPLVVVYIAAQRYITEGIATTGLKG